MVFNSEEYRKADRRASRLEDLLNSLTDAKHVIQDMKAEKRYEFNTLCDMICQVESDYDELSAELDEAVDAVQAEQERDYVQAVMPR